MVNSENFSAKSPSLRTSLCGAVGAVLQDVGLRLREGAGLESLCRIRAVAEPAGTAELEDILAETAQVLGTSLAEDLAVVVGIELVAAQIASTEFIALKALASRARKTLNMVTRVPNVSTEATAIISQIKAGSVSLNPFEPLLATLKNRSFAAFEKIQACNPLHLSDLRTFWNKDAEDDARQLFHLVISSADSLLAASSRAGKLFSSLAAHGEENVGLAHFENKRRANDKLKMLINELQWNQARVSTRESLCEGRFIRTLFLIEDSCEQLKELWTQLEICEPSTMEHDQESRYVEGENYLYVQSLARALISNGENPRDVEKLAHNLFEYAQKNRAPCAEMLDEEIYALHPCIQRDGLSRARLEVRLNDNQFPLSVAHKEWVQGKIREH